MHRRQYPFPDLSAWPPDEELISRKALAALLQVTEETVKNWYRAGLMPDRVQVMPEGILRDKPRYFWHTFELREWAQRMIGIVFKRRGKPKGTRRRLEWIAGQGWVEMQPAEPAPPAARTRAPSRPRRSTKIPGSHLVILTRLERQLAALDRLEELEEEPQEPVEVPQRQRVAIGREEPEPIPFASNARRPSRVGGYWS